MHMPCSLKKLSWAVRNSNPPNAMNQIMRTRCTNLTHLHLPFTRSFSTQNTKSPLDKKLGPISASAEIALELPTEKSIDEAQMSSIEAGKTGDDGRRQWKDIFRLAWEDYKYTWEGFTDNLKTNKPKKVQKNESTSKFSVDIDSEHLLKKQKELQDNVKRNVKSLEEEGSSFVTSVTGIESKHDLKVWAMVQLRLANKCVASFMEGYRQGRDDEVDKMLNQYFKDIDLGEDTEKSREHLTPIAATDSNQQKGRKRRRRKQAQ